MICPRLMLALCVLSASPLAARADELQKLRSRGAEVFYLDADLRGDYAKMKPQALPESRRKGAKANAVAFDWSTVLSRPYSYTQKVTPYCWAFASVTALEWNWAFRNGGNAPVLAVQPIIDRSQKEGGAPLAAAMEVLLQQGTCPLNAYPYTGKPAKVRANAPLIYRIIAWGPVLPGKEIATPVQIKQALVENGPVVANVHATPQFEAYKGGVFREHFKVAEGKPLVNHSVVIVGWDDRRGQGGCWKVQNSWGPKWGEGGYMWIEYGCNSIGQEATWVRAQSIHYQLPANTQKQITGEIAPFHRWPQAVAIAPPAAVVTKATPAEAVKLLGKRIEVQFQVKGFTLVQPSGDIEMRSEEDPQNENCLSARLLKAELKKFPIQEEKEILKAYGRKEIRIRGSIQPVSSQNRTKLIVEVGDPSQIEIVE